MAGGGGDSTPDIVMGDTDLAGEDGVEEALPSELTLARPVLGLNVELKKVKTFLHMIQDAS